MQQIGLDKYIQFFQTGLPAEHMVNPGGILTTGRSGMQWTERLGDWRRFDRVQSKALAAAIESLIIAGDLLPGDRLPPERGFAERIGVSRTLVVSAYASLRDAGWVRSRQGSGTEVARGVPGHVAATRRPQRSGNPMTTRRTMDRTLIDLSIATAIPDPAWLTLSPGARTAMLQEYAYQPQGMLALRERIAARYDMAGIPTTPSQILVTTGAQQAISLIAQRYAAKQPVLMEVPTYFGAIDCFRAAGALLRPVPIERTGEGPQGMIRRIAAGEAALAYICPTIQNPTGLIWSVAERRAVVRAAAASETLLIVDDSLSDLAFHEAPPTPAMFRPDAPVVTIGSLSKTLWGGLRIGWLRAHEDIVTALAGDRLVHDLGSSLVSSAMACDLLDRYDALLAARRATLAAQRDACVRVLRERLPEWQFAIPQGGMFLWIGIPGGDAGRFVQHALEQKVVLTPGSGMFAGPGRPDMFRLSFAAGGPVWQEVADRLVAAWSAFRE
jgi:DNA-binding transcriptional MocR family regulator